MFLFGSKEISVIEKDQRFSGVFTNDVTRRGMVPIAVIDDEPFRPQQNLQNNGYDIRVMGDIKTLKEIENFNVILCDLQGVGVHLGGSLQGAFLIDEIKRNHPEKFVVAYTGGAVDDAVALKAAESADYFIKKDASIDEWRDRLDRMIALLSNPIDVWYRQRDAMVNKNVSTSDILKIENAFVRSVLKSDDRIIIKFGDSLSLGSDARSIIQSLVASGIFKLLVS